MPGKARTSLQILITIAGFMSGSLAGGNIYRYVIEVPAWRHLNIGAWAEYSRHADLGNGIFLFPFEAIGSALFLMIVSIIIFTNRSALRTAAVPAYSATFLALVGLALTFFAAPYMLSLRAGNNDPVTLQHTFDRFHFFGLWRAVAQILSFFACVWAMGKIFGIGK